LKRSCLPGMDGIQPFPRWSGGHHPLFIIFIFRFIFILPRPSCLKNSQLVASVIKPSYVSDVLPFQILVIKMACVSLISYTRGLDSQGCTNCHYQERGV
jgi:hypothetical protein